MAIYHLHVKNISRGDGRSVVAAAAYRAGEVLANAAEEGESAFGGRRDVLFTAILLPAAAPGWMADRASLWNAAEAAERRKDARLAKEIEFALPRELPQREWQRLARAMAEPYVAAGLVADVALHEDGRGENPHVHLLLTTRVVGPDGFGAKLRATDGVAFVREARARWATLANAALAAAGLGVSIDPRSHQAAGITRTPTQHRGPDRAERRAKRERAKVMQDDKRSTMQDHKPDASRTSAERRVWSDPAIERRATLDEALRQARLDEDRPVPDPDGNPISQDQRDEAEARMLTEMEGPTRAQIRAPHPGKREVVEGRPAAEDWVAAGSDPGHNPQPGLGPDWWGTETVAPQPTPEAVRAASPDWAVEAGRSAAPVPAASRDWWEPVEPEPTPTGQDIEPDCGPERRR